LVIAGGLELDVEGRKLCSDDGYIALVAVVVEELWLEARKFDHLANPK
jgi:hypothetical protein